MSAQQSRLFSRDEAIALIPRLRPLLLTLRETKQSLDRAQAALASMTSSYRTNGGAPKAAELEERVIALVRDARATIERIEALGVVVKDPDRGLVDFPYLRDDRLVYLCWMVDESTIEYWHDLDAGFAGRQRL